MPADDTAAIPGRRGRRPGRPNRADHKHIEELIDSWARERPDLDQGELLLQLMVMRLGRMVERAYDRRCQERFGISGADMRILLALRRAGPPFARRPTDLYRALLVTSGAITKQVDRLAALRLVERLPDPEFTGGFLVQLTATGLAAANGAVEHLARDSMLAGRYDRTLLPTVLSFHRRLLAELDSN